METMRTRRRGEQGFTLIELLIVVAILGILAAVVIPNMGRLLGGGERTARNNEYESVKTGVVSLMVDNNLASIPNPVATTGVTPCTTGKQDMTTFPDITAAAATGKVRDPSGNTYTFSADKVGYLLWGNDITGNSSQTALVNYVETDTATYCYTINNLGEITQYDTAGAVTNPKP